MIKILMLPLLFLLIIPAETTTYDLVNKILRNVKKPKIWHLYIKQVLHKMLQELHLYHGSIRGTSYQLYKGLENFVNYSKTLVTKPKYSLTVKPASGRLELEDVGTNVLFVHKIMVKDLFPVIYLPHVSYSWKFQTEIKLRVQLKFRSIYFQSSPHDCLKGNITIYQNFERHLPFVKPYLFNNMGLNSYFCGQMAKFLLYSSSNNVFIKLSVMKDVFYKVNMSFMVIDNNIIKTKRGNFDLLQTLYSSVLIKGSVLVISYHVLVKKTHKIVLKIPTDVILVVFDGPGFQSTKLKNVHIKYDKEYKYSITTTFQCMVQVLSYEYTLTTASLFSFFFKSNKAAKLQFFF